MSTRQASAGLLNFLRTSNHAQNGAFKPDEKYRLSYREDIPLNDVYIPAYINALVGIYPGSGFTIVEQTRVRCFQYAYLSTCEAQGSAYERCRIEVGNLVLVLEGRNLDRIVDLVTERLLVKLFLPPLYEEASRDSGPREMTWIRKLSVTNLAKDRE